jgi:hypothetical protein
MSRTPTDVAHLIEAEREAGEIAVPASRFESALAFTPRAVRFCAMLLAVLLVSILSATSAQAATPPAPLEVEINPVIDVAALVGTVFAIGGAGLVAAFGVGGAFRIAGKVYRWIFSKIG